MKKKDRNNKLAQTTLAYVIFIGVVIFAFSAMTAKLRQKTQASYKDSADAFSEGRQFGSFTTSGGIAPFKFPDLPVGTTASLPPQGLSDPVCNPSNLNSLRIIMQGYQQTASNLQQNAAASRQAATDAQAIAGNAETLAGQKRQEAVDARNLANATQAAAVAKRKECNDCWPANNNPIPSCLQTCMDAGDLEAEAAREDRAATALETEAARLEAEAARLLGIANAANATATSAENQAASAAQTAENASDDLQKQNAACYP